MKVSEIEMVSETEFRLTSGNNKMTLHRKENGSWVMFTDNPSARAWSGFPSFKDFPSLTAVEDHYKSWRGIAALVTTK